MPILSLFVGKVQGSTKERQDQPSFLSWSYCDGKSHWKLSGNQHPSWKRPDGIIGMPPRLSEFHF